MYPTPFVYPFGPYDIQGRPLKINEPVTIGFDLKKPIKKLFNSICSATKKRSKSYEKLSSSSNKPKEKEKAIVIRKHSSSKYDDYPTIEELQNRVVCYEWFMMDCAPLYANLSTTVVEQTVLPEYSEPEEDDKKKMDADSDEESGKNSKNDLFSYAKESEALLK